MKIPFWWYRFNVARGEYRQGLDCSCLPDAVRPASYDDLRGERGALVVAAWSELLGEKLTGVEEHIGSKTHIAGVYGREVRNSRTERRANAEQLAWARQAWRLAQKRSADKGAACNITRAEVVKLIVRSGGKCELTGIPFQFEAHGPGLKSPWKPSLDRIDSSAGYRLQNCRVVCCAVNLAMNEWGIGVLDVMARAYVSKNSDSAPDFCPE